MNLSDDDFRILLASVDRAIAQLTPIDDHESEWVTRATELRERLVVARAAQRTDERHPNFYKDQRARWREEDRQMREEDRTIARLSELLKGVAIALKGPEPELVWHDWSDLPALAAEKMQLLGDLGNPVNVPGSRTEIEALVNTITYCARRLLELNPPKDT